MQKDPSVYPHHEQMQVVFWLRLMIVQSRRCLGCLHGEITQTLVYLMIVADSYESI